MSTPHRRLTRFEAQFGDPNDLMPRANLSGELEQLARDMEFQDGEWMSGRHTLNSPDPANYSATSPNSNLPREWNEVQKRSWMDFMWKVYSSESATMKHYYIKLHARNRVTEKQQKTIKEYPDEVIVDFFCVFDGTYVLSRSSVRSTGNTGLRTHYNKCKHRIRTEKEATRKRSQRLRASEVDQDEEAEVEGESDNGQQARAMGARTVSMRSLPNAAEEVGEQGDDDGENEDENIREETHQSQEEGSMEVNPITRDILQGLHSIFGEGHSYSILNEHSYPVNKEHMGVTEEKWLNTGLKMAGELPRIIRFLIKYSSNIHLGVGDMHLPGGLTATIITLNYSYQLSGKLHASPPYILEITYMEAQSPGHGIVNWVDEVLDCIKQFDLEQVVQSISLDRSVYHYQQIQKLKETLKKPDLLCFMTLGDIVGPLLQVFCETLLQRDLNISTSLGSEWTATFAVNSATTRSALAGDLRSRTMESQAVHFWGVVNGTRDNDLQLKDPHPDQFFAESFKCLEEIAWKFTFIPDYRKAFMDKIDLSKKTKFIPPPTSFDPSWRVILKWIEFSTRNHEQGCWSKNFTYLLGEEEMEVDVELPQATYFVFGCCRAILLAFTKLFKLESADRILTPLAFCPTLLLDCFRALRLTKEKLISEGNGVQSWNRGMLSAVDALETSLRLALFKTGPEEMVDRIRRTESAELLYGCLEDYIFVAYILLHPSYRRKGAVDPMTFGISTQVVDKTLQLLNRLYVAQIHEHVDTYERFASYLDVSSSTSPLIAWANGPPKILSAQQEQNAFEYWNSLQREEPQSIAVKAGLDQFVLSIIGVSARTLTSSPPLDDRSPTHNALARRLSAFPGKSHEVKLGTMLYHNISDESWMWEHVQDFSDTHPLCTQEKLSREWE